MARPREPIENLFTDNQKQEIINAYQNGMTYKEVGEKFGMPRRTAMKLLSRLGVESRSHKEAQKSRFDDDFVEKVKELRPQGYTLQQIADLTNRSVSAVNRVCQKYQIEGDNKYPADDVIKNEYINGSSIKQISQNHNVSSWYIHNKLKQMKVAMRPCVMEYSHPKKSQNVVMRNFEDNEAWFAEAYLDRKIGMHKMAELAGRSVGFVAHKLDKYGIKKRSLSESLTEFDKDELVKAYKHHGSMSKVAKRFNCTISTVQHALEVNDIVPTSTSEMFSGEGNPFYGKQHPQDIKDYCKEIGAKSGKQFWIDHPEYVQVVKEKQKIYWSDLARRYEVSKRTARLRKEGKCRSRRGVVQSRWGEMQFDSSYEMNFIEWCEDKEDIIFLERDFDLIEYEYNGKRHFVPDFRLWLSNGDFLVVEIKSDWLRMKEGEKQKILAGFGKFQDKFIVAANDFDKVEEHINILLSPLDFEFDELILSEIDSNTYLPFYQAFHYMGISGRRGWTIGAHLKDKLIAAATIGSITRQEIAFKQNIDPSHMRELVRFCIHPQFHKKNMASWFLSRIVKLYKLHDPNISMLVSFADTTQGHIGTIYKASGWEFNGEARPNYHYEDNHGTWIHKKTVYDQAKKNDLTEREWAEKNLWRRMPEAAKMRFLLDLR